MSELIEPDMEEINGEDGEENPTVLASTVPENIIELKHTFGYDCKRFFNLCLIDDDTLVYGSGNILHYYSISKNKLSLRRTVFGGGIGFIIKNNNADFNNLTVAENGTEPTVFIYKYPEHEIVAELKGDGVRSFTCGAYSFKGDLIATQAGSPDYMLIIWNWQTSSIVLRSKGYRNIVLDVTFSQFNPILLASCGLNHAQFWKMTRTFTGLKLKNNFGRFGQTDSCDVYTVCMLADDTIISGCEWGNMLVWDDGLIKVEVTRKARLPCHTKPITRIIWMGNNEVMTVGMDGYARIWFWETVDLADPPEDDLFVEIDPIYEFRIGNRDESCESRHLVKARPHDDNDFEYYSQDGNGGVWWCDLNTESTPAPPKKLFSCHGGKIVAGQASPISQHIATLGEDGKLNIYNYETEKLLHQEPFNAPGRALIWLDTYVDPSGMVLFIGFEDGALRQVVLELSDEDTRVHFINATKPHAAPITFLEVAPSQEILVSGGMDSTVFLFHINNDQNGELEFVELIPMGFILLEGSPTCLHWDKNKPKTALIGCHTGEVYECDLPSPESIDFKKVRPTWRIMPVSIKMLKFKSVKNRVRRDSKTNARLPRKTNRLAANKSELQRIMELSPRFKSDESTLSDSWNMEENEYESSLYIPDTQSPVLWLQYTNEGTIWLSMGGYDAGYVYEFQFGEEEPISCTIIPEAGDVEIHSYLFIDKYLIFGMKTGQIRINAVKSNFRDLTDFWAINMHDNMNGIIPRIFTSHDGKWFFSIGHDGNIFYYHWNGPVVPRQCPTPSLHKVHSKVYKDIEDRNQLSLEEVKIQENLVKLREFEEDERRRLLPSFEVMQLQVDWITERCKALFQTKLNDVMEKLKHDVTGACCDAKELYELMFLPLEYIPFEVFAIRSETIVRVFRLPRLLVATNAVKVDVEVESEDEKSKLISTNFESSTSLPDSKLSKSSLASSIFDFTEKVLLRFYIKILEFFALLKQMKSEEIERVLEVCGDGFEEEEQSFIGSDIHVKIEEEGEDEEEEISFIEKAIAFLKNSIRENIEVKNLEITIIQEILHTLKSEFNNKVIDLKKTKSNLYKKYQKLEKQMLETGENVSLFELREIVLYNEYPEEVFKEPFIPLRSFESILWEKPMKMTADESKAEEKNEIIKKPEISEEDETISADEPSEQWTIDMENLADKVNEEIESFDEECKKVFLDRVQFEVEIKYLEYLDEISNQELIILQDCEVTEKNLEERDEIAKSNRNEISGKIKNLKSEIDAMNKSLSSMRENIKRIQVEFNEAVKGNKFMKFLKRIFERKFKPQKERKPDNETESSTDESSSDDDEDDTESSESDNLTAIRLADESHCPTGCDKKLYELTFDLRAERHSLEQLYNGNRTIENKKKVMEELNNRMPAAEELCTKERSNLLAFRRLKEEKLNAVEIDLINNIDGFGLKIEQLNLDQEQYEKYLDDLLQTKKKEARLLKDELQRPIEIYTEKLKILLQMLTERDVLRRKKPSITKVSESEQSISTIPETTPPTPPAPFDFEAYASEKIMKLVQRFFFRCLSKHISEPYMRKYIPKVARSLGNIGRNFTCELADNIIDVIIENLQRIVPKKYLIHASLDDIRSLFKDIVAVFEVDPVDINPTALISESVEKVLKSYGKGKCANKTQRIILELSQVLIEELPMDDFRSPDTVKVVSKLLAREAVIIPNCLNVDMLVEQIGTYVKDHMLSAVTAKIIRKYAEELLKELIVRKGEEVCLVKPKDKASRDIRRKKRILSYNKNKA